MNIPKEDFIRKIKIYAQRKREHAGWIEAHSNAKKPKEIKLPAVPDFDPYEVVTLPDEKKDEQRETDI